MHGRAVRMPQTRDESIDRDATSARSRRLARGLFLASLLVLPVQDRVMSVVGEPYPALMLPGFGTVPAESDGSARFEQGAFVAELEDGTQVVYSSGEIFDAMPLGHRVPVMSHFHPRSFEPVDESSPSRSRALRRRLLPLFWPSPSSPEALAARGARADWVFG